MRYFKLTGFLFFSISCMNVYAASSKSNDKNASKNSQMHHHPMNVFLASPDYIFGVNFTALIVQPVATNMHYAAEALPLPVPTPNWIIYDIQTDYQFGFNIGLEGVFHKTNTSLMLDWKRFYSSDSSSVSVASQDMLGPFFTIGPDASPYTSATGHVNFHFNEVHLDYGMFVNFGDRTKTNVFTGVSYAYIKQILTSTYSNASESISRSITVPSTFSGAGPQVGMTFSYQIVEGLHLAGDSVASLLVGAISNKTTYESESPLLVGLGISPPNTQTTSTSSKTQLIPAWSGSLGVNYLQNVRQSFWVCLEAGYSAEVYINAIQSVDMGSEVPIDSIADSTVGVYARTFQRNLSNFALAGPYIKLALNF